MKRCSRCGQFKPESEFYKNKQTKTGLNGHCKSCHIIGVRDKQLTRLEYFRSRKTACVKCGEDREYVIQFHHIDPTNKKFEISKGSGTSMQKITDELSKCVCLCSNCHLEFHHIYGKQPDDPRTSLMDYLDIEDISPEELEDYLDEIY
jgi:hypothetical protein